jgi:hypothetical protein
MFLVQERTQPKGHPKAIGAAARHLAEVATVRFTRGERESNLSPMSGSISRMRHAPGIVFMRQTAAKR